MTRDLATIAGLSAAAFFLFTSPASADDMPGETIPLPPAAEASAGYTDAPTPSEDDGWHYCSHYVLPLTRNLPDSGLPLAGRILLYPLAAAVDIAQLPFGALAGLAGE